MSERAPDALPDDLSELRTVDETARILRVGRTTVYEEMRRGRLPSLSIRSRRFVRLGDVNYYIEQRASEGFGGEQG